MKLNVFILRRPSLEPLRIFWHSILHGLEHQLFTRAAAMTYTTLLAIVPTIILLHAIASAFDILDLAASALPILDRHLQLGLPLQDLQPVLHHAETVGITQLGFIGLGSLFVTFVLAFDSLEMHLNTIWGIAKARTYVRKAVLSIPFLLLAGLLLALTAGLFSYLQNWLQLIQVEGVQIFDKQYWRWIRSGAMFLLVHAGLWFTIFLIYRTIPYTKVQRRAAMISSAVALVAIRLLIWGLLAAQSLIFQRMSLFYGSLAFIPIVMLLVFGVWSIILFGNALCWRMQYWPPKIRYKRHWKSF